MRELLNAAGVANRILMRRGAAPQEAFLIVEGDDDHKLYSRLVEPGFCRLQAAYGKPMVLSTIAILAERGASGIAAIVDADFDRIHGTPAIPQSVMLTDYHDAECMLIASPALDIVIHEFGAISPASEVRSELLAIGRVLGELRFASCCLSWHLRFDRVQVDQFVDPKTMNISETAMIEVVRGHQGGSVAPPTAVDMAHAIATVRSQRHGDLQLCNGHDLIQLLALGLRKCWAQNRPADVTEGRIATALRLAFHRSYFEGTQLLSALRAWEAQNTPFAICKLTPH